jgi:hypothetical protein
VLPPLLAKEISRGLPLREASQRPYLIKFSRFLFFGEKQKPRIDIFSNYTLIDAMLATGIIACNNRIFLLCTGHFFYKSSRFKLVKKLEPRIDLWMKSLSQSQNQTWQVQKKTCQVKIKFGRGP